MELRQLEYFVTTAEELHFGRAAARMRVTQPSLTQQIQRLELELEVLLFNRDSHTVELTPAGMLFFQKARTALDLADEAVRAARHHSEEENPGGTVRIGFVCPATRTVLPSAVRRFQRRRPGTLLTLKELWTGEQLVALAEGRLDLAFVFGPVHGPAFRTKPVSRESFVVLLPSSHPLARQARVDLRDLDAQPLALFQRELSSSVYDRLFGVTADSGVSLNVSHEVQHPSAIPLLVAAGCVVGLSSAARARRARIPGVVQRPLDGVHLDEEIHLVWRAGESSLPVSEFVQSVVPDGPIPARLAS
jgi:DNA-binding transcriptional LysR family regulator